MLIDYEEVKQVLPNVSLGIIYRNLHLVEREALSCYGSAASRFDGNPKTIIILLEK